MAETGNNKPIDRWLGLFALAMGAALYLLPKTEPVIIVCCTLIWGSLAHPCVKFWWVEDRKWRQVLAGTILTAGVVWLGLNIKAEKPRETVAVTQEHQTESKASASETPKAAVNKMAHESKAVATTPKPAKPIVPSISQTNSGSSINVQQVTTGLNSPIGPVTINSKPLPLVLLPHQVEAIAAQLQSFRGQTVNVDVENASEETDKFANDLISSLSKAGIMAIRSDMGSLLGGCRRYPGITFMAGVNRLSLVKAIWDSLVAAKAVEERADHLIPGCSRGGEPDELHIEIFRL